MDRLTLRWKVVIDIGVLIVLISLFADPWGLGRLSWFRATLGVVVGALIVLAGGTGKRSLLVAI
jgi:hypothetical protein